MKGSWAISVVVSIVILGTISLAPPASAVTLNPGDIIVADVAAGIIRVDPVTGDQTLVSSGGLFVSPFDVAIDANGDIIVADVAAGIIRVDPDSGDQTLISSGGLFVGTPGVTIDANGDIIVSGGTGGGIIRVDPTGDGAVPGSAQTEVSSKGLFIDPFGVDIEANGNIIVVETTTFGGSIIRVDPDSGDQEKVSENDLFDVPLRVIIVPTTAACDALDKASEKGQGQKKGLERAKSNNNCN